MIGANLLMMWALYTNNFSVHYVAQVGSLDTPRHISIVSLWSSLEGSILFWGGILGLYVAAAVSSLGEKHKEYAPFALHVLLAICVFFSLLVASVSDPFGLVDPAPTNGPGPNPLLQNDWRMIIHPPMLYFGYVGMSVPFSLICAALLAGRLESGWMGPVRMWMLVPWAFLTMGIMLGGWWSYEVLGWGGAWAWDPVENASFHPWLTGTAFLHSAMVLQRRGRQRDWTLVLGMSTFLLTLLGTFMTRSGVFNSVHSFTQSDIGPVFLAFIAVVLVYSVGLLATRAHLLDESAMRVDAEIGPRTRAPVTVFSREFAILIQNALFTVFTFVVLFGTLYPLLMEAMTDKRLSVGEPYFNDYALPLGNLLVFVMGIGPALPWGRIDERVLARRLAPAVVVGLLVVLWSYAAGFDKRWTLLTMFNVGFAFWANFNELLEPVRQRMLKHGERWDVSLVKVWGRARRRFGGHVAHYGVLFAVFSLALTKGYRNEHDFAMTKGQTVQFAGVDVTYAGFERRPEPHRTADIARFEAKRGGQTLGVFEPRMNRYPTQREPIVTPDVYQTPTYDLYFSLIDLGNDGDQVVVRLISQPYQVWLWLSAPLIMLGTFIAIWPQRERQAATVAGSVAAAPGRAK